MSAPRFLVVLTAVPDVETAQAIALDLVGKRLAACVHIQSAGRSFYWWDGRVTEADERLLVIKTRAERYAELEKALKALHPYTVPEIIALPIDRGLEEYLGWIEKETTPQ